MFEGNSYQEKRAHMLEILVQQMLQEQLRTATPETRQRLFDSFGKYARGMQVLRDQEADRILGPEVHAEGEKIADLILIRDYLEANLGRTYFNFVNHTKAPAGAIGTADFGKKFADWVKELPELDVALNPNMQTGFYRDSSTVFGKNLPLLVVRHGQQITVIIFNEHYSANTLHFDHVAPSYRWDAANHYPLRGEMFTYRNSLTVDQFEAAFAEALAAHTDVALVQPEVQEVATETTGFVAHIDELPATNLDGTKIQEPVVIEGEGVAMPEARGSYGGTGFQVVEETPEAIAAFDGQSR